MVNVIIYSYLQDDFVIEENDFSQREHSFYFPHPIAIYYLQLLVPYSYNLTKA